MTTEYVFIKFCQFPNETNKLENSIISQQKNKLYLKSKKHVFLPNYLNDLAKR